MLVEEKTTNQALYQADRQYYLPTFNRIPLAFKRAQGARMWDVEGKEYLDALAGIAVCNLGHCHPKVVKAVQEQAAQLMHISNFFVSEPQVALSEKLVQSSGLDRVFFSNSGAESVEGAIKIARKYAFTKGRGGHIISMQGSFHGRTLATIATGKEKMQRGFGPMPAGFHKVPFNDIEAVRALASHDVAAIILEPVQGEGGINVAKPCYLRALRELCDQEDIVLIFDEIQCGIGRTGELFAKDHYEVQPDIMTLAKGLGSGLPVGAILSNEKVSSAIEFGDHGTTFGGNPMACAAGLATLNAIEEEDLLRQTSRKGFWLKNMLQDRLGGHPKLKAIRGLGLMIGVEFDFPTKPLVLEMIKHGVIANATADHVLRMVPPLVITYEELEHLADTIVKCIGLMEERGEL
ncbi:aspartate aminotransferase family protein [Phaeodactylibacter luteus]|uniref:Acetylornithine aminotransferase n=1 Tax=Phaeodactylibacter luteus TaxID=1564516 RepID=A0A5C6S2S0_9BACT|nr:aspartate aminotransferase family protein [Phaeodactylibacter luteus]TXB67912.1 aspartate aminotransferase family protein [Phaeodactylibacter luteus]